ncbi:hypothetical protein BV20DRAFT_70353 [Pilatotrama ljubarskyi]|nr:hypothetical protein BV20DRAFT_70353 [Pilatotrama ljubarskyi]
MRQYFDIDSLSAEDGSDEPISYGPSYPRLDVTFPSKDASDLPWDASYPLLVEPSNWLDSAFPAIEPAVPHTYAAGLDFGCGMETTASWSPAAACSVVPSYPAAHNHRQDARPSAAEEIGVDISLPQVIPTGELAVRAASYGQPLGGPSPSRSSPLPAEPKAPWSALLVQPTVPVSRPSAPGRCERKRGAPDAEIWSSPSKKAKCTASHPSPNPAPSAPSSRPPSREARASTCNDGPKPIAVPPKEGLFCPMPNCGVKLAPVDSIWRGHFKTVHHKDLCAAGDSCGAKACVHACPLPTRDGKPCVTKEPMTADSLGRHVLNVHLQLVHRCPLCGVEKVQRYSACKRHIDKACSKRHRRGARS